MLNRITKRIHTRIKLIFLLIFFSSLHVYAQEVIEINENGSKIIQDTELTRLLIANPENSKRIILSWYSSLGFLNAKVEKVSEKSFDLNKGCLFSISELKISGDKFLEFSQENLGSYSQKRLEDEIKLMLGALEEDGYLFAKAEIISFEPDLESCEVSILIEVEEGQQLYSEGILFPGAKSNKPEYLQRISGFKDSVLITTGLLEELRANLLQSELFEIVGKPEVYLEDDSPMIVIPVQERVLNQFDGLLGYVPDQNGKGQVVGDFQLSLWNVLNQGNGIGLEYQRLRPETSRLNIRVSQDYIGSIPIGVGFSFNFYQNDTTYQTRALSLDSYYLVSKGLRLTTKIESVTSVSGNDVDFNLEPDGKKRSAELGFIYSTVDNFAVPTRGLSLGISFGVSNKSVDIDSIRAFSQQFIHSETAYYFPIRNKTVLAFSTYGYFLNTDRPTENDLIQFGGANSFRGYSEEQFRASSLIWGDIEYRFLVNSYSYLFAFGAIGQYHRPRLLTESNSDFKVTDTLYSTGFGISYKIRIGRLKFTYAISPEESLGNGKIHLGIATNL